MKKKIFGVTLIVTLAVVAAFNINVNKLKNCSGDLALSNVEALADDETIDCQVKVYVKTETQEAYMFYFCQYDGSDIVRTNVYEETKCEGEGTICCTPRFRLLSTKDETKPCVHF